MYAKEKVMKKKFNNTNNTLGDIIKSVRKKKNFSQEALGKLVGLGKSGISKIENGKTSISLEDASVLLEAMGEKISVYVEGVCPSHEVRMKQIQFITVATCWFAEVKGISMQKAFDYLQKFQGIKFLEENYEYEQSLSKMQIVEDLTAICHNRRMQCIDYNKKNVRV